MVSTYTLPEDFPTSHSIKDLLRGNWNRKTSGVVFGLCGGFIALIVGSLVTLVSWFIDPKWHGIWLHQTGTFLFVVSLPLLILGAHCLDLLDKEQESAEEGDDN